MDKVGVAWWCSLHVCPVKVPSVIDQYHSAVDPGIAVEVLKTAVVVHNGKPNSSR